MLRPAEPRDLEDVRRWRNHPEVRAQFLYRDVITPEVHRAWWSRVSSDPGRRVLIYEHDGGPAGAVTFQDHDPVGRTAEWGFFLDLDGLRPRGALFGAWVGLEQAAIRYARDELRLAVLGARTLAANRPVLALHRRNGFVEVPERHYRTDIDGTPTDVLWLELRS
ncbi:GNAT family N-acetyltransferase [Catenuloplanes atrovinosus]|uniref:RimJ/RimL family protein N-acetyltransferase n=1 Tax=Catenuloplanes atrovinosus TaxID=137266 RepID=A0AAE4CC04_9ACTN|nr:GNAT family N-acetyltransferase [Catenuloplanes atrovinosus]MDR7278653.1 RimJ/RimL family protein N-acetyltransferase [Catenuloplanes atrovinosus]